MAAPAALQTTLTPLALQALVAAALVAVVAAVGLALFYALVAGSAAWLLMLVAGLVRMVWAGGRAVARTARAHLHRAAPALPLINPEGVGDLRVRSSG